MSDKYKINTSQNVSLEIEIAGIGDRMLALMIDYLLLMAIYFMFFLLFGLVDQTRALFISFAAIYSAVLFFYHFFLELLMKGQTIGKKVMDIRVIQKDGSVPGFFQYLVRNLIRPIDTFYYLGLIPVFFTPHYQRLGDIAAGTIVVQSGPSDILENLELDSIEDPEYMPVFDKPAVMRMDRQDVELIRRLVYRDKEAINWRLVGLMAKKMKQKTGMNTYADSNFELLKQLEKDYIYYK
ncbi:MAG: RDD family protein [Bacteroidales bacterium]